MKITPLPLALLFAVSLALGQSETQPPPQPQPQPQPQAQVEPPATPRMQRGRVEAGFSASLQSYSSGGLSSTTNILISFQLGFFPAEGFELEPQVMLLAPSSGDALFAANANVAYNFNTGSKAYPFILVGYGIANSVPVFNVPFMRYDFNAGVLNLGLGLKGFVAENVAIRIEYRYQKFSGEGNTQVVYGFSSTEKIDVTLQTVQAGLSVFF